MKCCCALRDDLEDRFKSASANGSNGRGGDWQQLLGKWDDTLSNALQLAPQKGVFAVDLDAFPENRICRRHRCGLKRGK
jgi:hypothetical protein